MNSSSSSSSPPKRLLGILHGLSPSSQKILLLYIFLLLLLLQSFHDFLQSYNSKWWLRFFLLPFFTYVLKLFTSTVLINANVIMHSGEYLALPQLLSRIRKTWKILASRLFYINMVEKAYLLLIPALHGISDATPSWLWWFDALIKPLTLVVNLLLLYLNMVWVVCLVVTVLNQFFQPGITGMDMSMTMRQAEEIIKEKRLEGVFMSFLFSVISTVHRKLLDPFLRRHLPVLVHQVPGCAGTWVSMGTYTYFACNCVREYGEKVLQTLAEQAVLPARGIAE